jgi:hypothetical protein
MRKIEEASHATYVAFFKHLKLILRWVIKLQRNLSSKKNNKAIIFEENECDQGEYL